MRAGRYRARVQQSRDAQKCRAGQRRLRVKCSRERDAAERARRGGESEDRTAESDGNWICVRKCRERKNLRRNPGKQRGRGHRRQIVEKPVATPARCRLAIARAQQPRDRDRRGETRDRNRRAEEQPCGCGRRERSRRRAAAAAAAEKRDRVRMRAADLCQEPRR